MLNTAPAPACHNSAFIRSPDPAPQPTVRLSGAAQTAHMGRSLSQMARQMRRRLDESWRLADSPANRERLLRSYAAALAVICGLPRGGASERAILEQVRGQMEGA
jgi:hypothetical protein